MFERQENQTRSQSIRGYGQIYGLKDPVTSSIRYVGVTSCGLRSRLTDHYYAAKKGINNPGLGLWLMRLAESGMRAEIILLENSYNRVESEKFWVAEMKRRGEPLFNITQGGLGHSGAPRTEMTKKKLHDANFGKTHNEKSRESMSLARKGVPKSASHKASIAAAHKGKKHSASHVENRIASFVSSGNGRKPKSPEHRKKLQDHLSKIAEARRSSRAAKNAGDVAPHAHNLADAAIDQFEDRWAE